MDDDRRPRIRRAGAFLLVLLAQFGIFEAALRTWGSSEAAPAFQGLFTGDEATGYRLKPGARIRFTTSEFDTDIAINSRGVRDDEEIGPKGPGERRIVILGDSLVLSVQVELAETFCKNLERRLNARGGPDRWRVINGGVQGYGPVQDWFFFDKVAAAFQPDVVLIVAFVGNDAIEAADAVSALDTGRPIEDQQPAINRMRRLVRSRTRRVNSAGTSRRGKACRYAYT